MRNGGSEGVVNHKPPAEVSKNSLKALGLNF